jgi:hypothetical protein
MIYHRIVEVAYPDATESVPIKQIKAATVTVKSGSKKVNICQHYINSSFDYFYNIRTAARAGNNVSVDAMKLVKAIEFVSNVEDDKRYPGLEWEKHANELLGQFEKQHSLKKIGIGIKYEDLQKVFLHVVTTRQDVFEADTIKTLISEYFDSIRNKNYHLAWNILSPDLQKNSVWDGDYFLYEAATSLIVSLSEPVWIDRFTYEYGSVTCHANPYGMASLVNLEGIFDFLKKGILRKREKTNLLRKLVEAKLNFKTNSDKVKNSGKFRWSIHNDNLAQLSSNDFSDLLLQKTILISYLELADKEGRGYYTNSLRRHFFNQSETKMDQFFSHDYKIGCRLINNKWMIDSIEISNR